MNMFTVCNGKNHPDRTVILRNAPEIEIVRDGERQASHGICPDCIRTYWREINELDTDYGKQTIDREGSEPTGSSRDPGVLQTASSQGRRDQVGEAVGSGSGEW